MKFHILNCLILSSYSPLMQAGVYAKAVHMLELDLLLKIRWINWNLHCSKVNMRKVNKFWLLRKPFTGAKTTGKRGIPQNVQRYWSKVRSFGIYKPNMRCIDWSTGAPILPNKAVEAAKCIGLERSSFLVYSLTC